MPTASRIRSTSCSTRRCSAATCSRPSRSRTTRPSRSPSAARRTWTTTAAGPRPPTRCSGRACTCATGSSRSARTPPAPGGAGSRSTAAPPTGDPATRRSWPGRPSRPRRRSSRCRPTTPCSSICEQNSGGSLALAVGDQARIFMTWLCIDGVPSTLWTPPDTSFRWTAGTPGTSLPGLMQEHLANDLNFLVNRPYLMAYQTQAQSGFANNSWNTVDHGHGRRDHPRRQRATTTRAGRRVISNEYVAQVGGLVPRRGRGGGHLPDPHGPVAAGRDPDLHQRRPDAVRVARTGTRNCSRRRHRGSRPATAIGLYYLEVGESVTPQIYAPELRRHVGHGQANTGVASHIELRLDLRTDGAVTVWPCPARRRPGRWRCPSGRCQSTCSPSPTRPRARCTRSRRDLGVRGPDSAAGSQVISVTPHRELPGRPDGRHRGLHGAAEPLPGRHAEPRGRAVHARPVDEPGQQHRGVLLV